ncbi:hypothetical protein CJD36_014560 [Flavipsychrobacter stenotrophus]|uniref:Secretion system C-terminal sorting domain-containing protein n=1 Tax=Flavipsychrobacter stenotrophus TaxID=2077091 RepID=A0A2S7ST56_9BACT|nr:T9SS type A sorting domain-containing protein [Flavipsychrobacter stenotrophus]PQJ09924.1 hypothetical protein CJD36_014560 [Flavipsychrobacter stenotrophus]
MLQLKLITGTALALMLTLPLGTWAKEKKTYTISVFSKYQSLPANTEAGEKTRNLLKTYFPGWMATTDKLNGTFTNVYGRPLAIDGNTLQEKATSIINRKLEGAGVKQSDWQLANEYAAPNADYINYHQIVNGHPVVFSALKFRFSKTGALTRIQMKNYGTPKNILLSITTEDAKNNVIKDIEGITVSSAIVDAEWAWFPIPQADGYTLHPAWHFKIKGNIKGSVPLILTGYVDGLTGEVLYRMNEVKETDFDVTIKGMVYKNGTNNPATLEALTDLDVTDGLTTLNTNSTGVLNTPLWILPVTAGVRLSGKWAIVVDNATGLTPEFSDTVLLPGTTYTYPTAAPASDRHVNAYYHVNRVHNFMKGYFPSFTDLDYPMPTNVDLTSGTCNAYYDGVSVNFFAADAQCTSFAEIGDIVYHEYGHAINDHFYSTHTVGSMMNDALNEAYADVWGMSITHDAVLGYNPFVGFGGFIRRYDMTPQVYPLDMVPEPHAAGQIIAGCWWDLGVNIGSVPTMTQLFTDVYYDVPDGPNGTEGVVYQEILIDALMADDNDANLSNGTPHYSQIVAAFARHGIYLEGDATLFHNEIINRTPGVTIPVYVSLSMTGGAYLHDLSLNYRTNSTGTWTSLIMAPITGGYSAAIPSQPQGTTVEYYFTMHDSLGIANGYFPLTCNPNIPAEQTTIPYQFGVGVVRKISNDFESNTTGWGIGGNPGDDATSGLWQWGFPVSNIFFTAFPISDHTTGAGKCLVSGTGAGSSWGTPVAGGATTALSPSFDISSFTSPVVEYYRWYSNEQGNNFKNDPWIVQIRNTAGGTWQTVERTYQPDVQWRHRIFPVNAFVTGASHIQVRFVASDSILSNWDDNGQSTTVGGVDDFYIMDKGDNTSVTNVELIKANVHPNPANDRLDIVLEGNDNKGYIELYDLSGKEIYNLSIEPGKSNFSINTGTITPGVYSLVIQTGKMIECKKVVIAH